MYFQVGQAILLSALCGSLAGGQESKPPDNTTHNKRDNKAGAETPQKQGTSEADRKMLQSIRTAVVAEKNFSIYAQNCKIVVRDGVVNLRGPVRTLAEKQGIEELAKQAGSLKVVNRLEITPDSKP
jgi:hyperosmotically inducible periplasmic protein